MGRICTICNHKDHESINSALIGNEPLRTIAEPGRCRKPRCCATKRIICQPG
jgi:hypothetical protein